MRLLWRTLTELLKNILKSNNRTIGVFRPSANEEKECYPANLETTKLLLGPTITKGKAIEKEPAPFEASIANLKKNLTER